MNVKTDKTGACRMLLQVTLGADEVQDDYQRIAKLFTRNVSLPGFRAGKAPRAMVERRYRKEIEKELQEQVLPRAYREVLEQEQITPAALLDVRDIAFGDDRGMQFSLLLDVHPVVKLPKYRKISVKIEPTDVTEQEIEDALQGVLRRMSRYEDAESGAVEDEDLVQIDYQGTAPDEQPLPEEDDGSSELLLGTDYWLPMTADNELLPGLVAALKEHQLGDEFSFTVSFPEDYRVASLAGRTLPYAVTIKGLRKLVAPALNEETLKQMGVESETALRERIQQDLDAAKKQQSENNKREQISQHLLEHTKLEVPESMVEQERNALLRSMLTRMAQQGASREVLEQHRDDIMASASRQAEERVKLRYILEKIAEEEDVNVDAADVDAAMQAMAAQNGMPVEKLRAEIEKQEDGMEHFQQDVRRDKVYTWLLEQAKIKE